MNPTSVVPEFRKILSFYVSLYIFLFFCCFFFNTTPAFQQQGAKFGLQFFRSIIPSQSSYWPKQSPQ